MKNLFKPVENPHRPDTFGERFIWWKCRKRTQVHRLPTEDVSQIHHNKVRYPNEIKYELSFHKEPSKCKNDGLCSGNQHLYITTDDKIKEGDWYIIQGASPEGVHNTLPNGGVKKEFAKKIIATTDPRLIENGVSEIPTSFIKEYCKVGGIDEVDVEHEEFSLNGGGRPNATVLEPKLNPDNTIIIHRIVEKVYNKQDLLELTMGNSNIIDWIEENL